MYYISSFDIDKCKYMKEHKWLKRDLNAFHSLPEQAQDIYLSYFLDLEVRNADGRFDEMMRFKDILCIIPEEVQLCQSPIEKTLYCAILFLRDLGQYKRFSHLYCVEPQYKIRTEKQNRIMDFAIIDADTDDQDIVVFIECDGFDYHAKTKEQFTYTQQKDRELKTMGYNVLHFTGTEIYTNPLKCADEVWKFVKKREENNG